MQYICLLCRFHLCCQGLFGLSGHNSKRPLRCAVVSGSGSLVVDHLGAVSCGVDNSPLVCPAHLMKAQPMDAQPDQQP